MRLQQFKKIDIYTSFFLLKFSVLQTYNNSILLHIYFNYNILIILPLLDAHVNVLCKKKCEHLCFIYYMYSTANTADSVMTSVGNIFKLTQSQLYKISSNISFGLFFNDLYHLFYYFFICCKCRYPFHSQSFCTHNRRSAETRSWVIRQSTPVTIRQTKKCKWIVEACFHQTVMIFHYKERPDGISSSDY